MTYNRMEATPIAGEHCRFCGDAKAPLVKTPCCQQWICCDTAFLSFRGGGRCQVEHERFSLCYSHYEDQHGGPWESCQKCRDFWTPRDYKTYAENPINWPRLLLDSRVVDLPMESNPTCVILSSLKPLFFNSLKNALGFSDNAGA
jgi:hypothetical protein